MMLSTSTFRAMIVPSVHGWCSGLPMPRILAIPSPCLLAEANRQLQMEILERRAAEAELQGARDELSALEERRAIAEGDLRSALRVNAGCPTEPVRSAALPSTDHGGGSTRLGQVEDASVARQVAHRHMEKNCAP